MFVLIVHSECHHNSVCLPIIYLKNIIEYHLFKLFFNNVLKEYVHVARPILPYLKCVMQDCQL